MAQAAKRPKGRGGKKADVIRGTERIADHPCVEFDDDRIAVLLAMVRDGKADKGERAGAMPNGT